MSLCSRVLRNSFLVVREKRKKCVLGANSLRSLSSSNSALSPESDPCPGESAEGSPPSADRRRALEEYKNYRKTKGEENVSWVDKIVYSSYLEEYLPKRSFKYRLREIALKDSMTAVERVGRSLSAAPSSWKFLEREEYLKNVTEEGRNADQDPSSSLDQADATTPSFPFKKVTRLEYVSDPGRIESEGERLAEAGVNVQEVLSQDEWKLEDEALSLIKAEVGTPDPTVKSSKVPCGGCGAILHCQDRSIPGYMSSQRFKAFRKKLEGELCARCFCLKNYNTALQINISAEDYPKVLSKIKDQYALVLLIVDVTDFPCSIWPGIKSIIGHKRPVILVGNKVDLIPRDSNIYLRRIEEGIYKAARECGLDSTKIVHTTLISATTGFGVENLISIIFKKWGTEGDIYIMGCTNVGKSSLFNALVHSDLCKAKVTESIQNATISQWPGTTLNLLKFPMTRGDRTVRAIRTTRLAKDAELQMAEDVQNSMMLRKTRDPKYAVLKERIGRSFVSPEIVRKTEEPVLLYDPFQHPKYHPKNIPRAGEWDRTDGEVQGRWCYDTPGSVNENQILDILTLPELLKTLPKNMIKPRTFFIHLGMSFFLGGLARIDYLEGTKPIRYTFFGTDQIPLSLVKMEDADDFYEKALGTAVLGVPEGNPERLSLFPSLLPNDFTLSGISHKESCGDIVLSSAGWVAVTVGIGQSVRLRVHTPGGRGIFLRQPSILPFSVNLKGPRIRGSFAYLPHRVFLPNPNSKQ